MTITDTELKHRIVRLLKEDEEFRYMLIGILATVFARRDEISAILDEIRNLRMDFNTRMEELRRDFNERIIKLEERVTRLEERFIKLEERMEELRRDFNERIIKLDVRITGLEERMEDKITELRTHLDALGERWGTISEEAFRNGLINLLEKKFDIKVMRWTHFDEKGYVYGHPSPVEVDIIVRDKEHILIEIKSSTGRGDILEFKRIGEFYEKVVGVKPELWIITPYIRKTAMKLAEVFGIRVITTSELYK